MSEFDGISTMLLCTFSDGSLWPINGNGRRWPIAEDVDHHLILSNFLVDVIGLVPQKMEEVPMVFTFAECPLGLQPSLSESVAAR